MAGGGVALHFRAGEEVVAQDAVGTRGVLQRDHGAERRHRPAGGPCLQAADVGAVASRGVVGLRHDLIGFAEQVEGIDEAGAQIGLERGEDGLGGDPQRFRLVPVDVGEEAWGPRVEGGEGLADRRLFLGFLRQRIGDLFQSLRTCARLILDDHLEAACRADAADRGGGQHPHVGPDHRGDGLLQRGQNAVGGAMIVAALIEVVEDDVHLRGVGHIGLGDRIGAGVDRRRLDPRGPQDPGGDIPCDRVGPCEAGALRQLHGDEVVPLVLNGNEALRRRQHAPDGQGEQNGVKGQHQHGGAHRPLGEPTVGVAQAVEASVEEAGVSFAQPAHAACRRRVGVRLHDEGRQRRGQGEGQDQRNHRRGGDGQGELAVELAGDARQERRRHEHGDEDHGDRDQSAAHLVHGHVRGVAGGGPGAQQTLHILHHHDGVIDHDADGQHQTEQGEVVQGKAEGRHDRAGADQGDRDGENRDDRRPPALQEHQDDEDHEADGDDQRLLHLVDGGADIFGGVVDDLVVEAGGEVLLQLDHRLLDRVRRGDGVGAGLGLDALRGGGKAGHVGVDRIVLRRQLDPRHVAHTGQRALGAALDDDVGELVRLVQTAAGVDVHLEGARRPDIGRSADLSRAGLQIVRLERGDDLVCGQVAGCGLVRVDPDAHGVVAGGAAADVADPRNAQDPVADVQAGVVGDILLIEGAVRRIEVNGEQRVGRRLAHDHADLAHRVRQLGRGGGDAVFDELLRFVEVDPQAEGDRDRQAPVAGRAGRDVVHVVDAVDLALDRACDRVGDQLRRGAGIARRHGDGRRDDLRVLRDRQAGIGDGADQRDQHRYDHREGRSLDEEVGEPHLRAVNARRWRWSPSAARRYPGAATPWRGAARRGPRSCPASA